MIIRSASGLVVHVNNLNHLQQHADVLPHLEAAVNALGQLQDQRRFVEIDVDLGQTIGMTYRVETNDGDDVYYEVRPGRGWPSRFVRGKQPTASSHVTLILKRTKKENNYVLITAFIGTVACREPGDPSLRDLESRQKAEEFWSKHALIAPTS